MVCIWSDFKAGIFDIFNLSVILLLEENYFRSSCSPHDH